MKYLTFTLFLMFSIVGCSTNQNYKPLDKRSLDPSWSNATDKGVPRAKLFANEIFPYAVLSYDAYDKDPTLYEQFPFPKNESWTQILVNQGIENDIGFGAKAWIRKYGGFKEVIVAFRGTDSFFNDFFRGNLVFFKPYIYRTHFDAANEFVYKVKDYMAKNNLTNLIFTGHSLGGGLAEYSHSLNPNSKAITFDPSFNTGRIYSLFEKSSEANVIRAYEKGEILEWPRKLFLWDFEWDNQPWENEINTVWFQFYSSNPVDAHDMQDLAMSLVKVASLDGNTTAQSILTQLKPNHELAVTYINN